MRISGESYLYVLKKFLISQFRFPLCNLLNYLRLWLWRVKGFSNWKRAHAYGPVLSYAAFARDMCFRWLRLCTSVGQCSPRRKSWLSSRARTAACSKHRWSMAFYGTSNWKQTFVLFLEYPELNFPSAIVVCCQGQLSPRCKHLFIGALSVGEEEQICIRLLPRSICPAQHIFSSPLERSAWRLPLPRREGSLHSLQALLRLRLSSGIFLRYHRTAKLDHVYPLLSPCANARLYNKWNAEFVYSPWEPQVETLGKLGRLSPAEF